MISTRKYNICIGLPCKKGINTRARALPLKREKGTADGHGCGGGFGPGKPREIPLLRVFFEKTSRPGLQSSGTGLE